MTESFPFCITFWETHPVLLLTSRWSKLCCLALSSYKGNQETFM